MANNKMFQWIDHLKGMCQTLARDKTIMDTAKMLVNSLMKTYQDQKVLPTNQILSEKPKKIESEVVEVKSNAKDVVPNDIRDIQLPEKLSSNTEGKQKSSWDSEGIFSEGSSKQ